jgi:hypothetical protein
MPLKPLPKPPKPGTNSAPRPSAKPAKTFTTEAWDGSTSGEKIILYGETGMGKTTLASMAPDPVFIGLDDGGRKIRNPKTGERLRHVPDIETFEDVRGSMDYLVADPTCKTAVLDTVTLLQSPYAEAHTFQTVCIKNDRTGATRQAEHIEDYGFGKGYKHLWNTMRLPLLQGDRLAAAGKNIIVIAQLMCHKLTNDHGDEYLKEGPQLYHSEKNWSILKTWVEWADHVFRIRPLDTRVLGEKKKAVKSTERVIDTLGDNTFYAKSRTLDDPVIAFSTKDDDSLWQLLFEGE